MTEKMKNYEGEKVFLCEIDFDSMVMKFFDVTGLVTKIEFKGSDPIAKFVIDYVKPTYIELIVENHFTMWKNSGEFYVECL